MAPTREITSPMVTVTLDQSGNDDEIRIRFTVPGSTFGPVEIVLYIEEANALATSILEQTGG